MSVGDVGELLEVALRQVQAARERCEAMPIGVARRGEAIDALAGAVDALIRARGEEMRRAAERNADAGRVLGALLASPARRKVKLGPGGCSRPALRDARRRCPNKATTEHPTSGEPLCEGHWQEVMR